MCRRSGVMKIYMHHRCSDFARYDSSVLYEADLKG